jgi:hypothetical protein
MFETIIPKFQLKFKGNILAEIVNDRPKKERKEDVLQQLLLFWAFRAVD